MDSFWATGRSSDLLAGAMMETRADDGRGACVVGRIREG